MKKIIIVIIVLAVIGIGMYFLFQKQNNAGNNSGAAGGNQPKLSNDSETADNMATGSKNPYVGDDFMLTPPEGWIRTELPSTLAAYQNKEETFEPGSAADKIHFKSYFAISFDNANGQTLDGITNLVKKQTAAVVPSINFAPVSETTINGLPARMAEANLTMQNVDFKILIAIILANNKYYTISFNTTADKWAGYKDAFYNAANSFKTKE